MSGRFEKGPGSPGCEWPDARAMAMVDARRGRRGSPVAIVLGSGLGDLAHSLEDPITWAAAEIPGYPTSTVAGHEGKLRLGQLAGRDVWMVQGRVHLYEGYSAEWTTRYVALLFRLGVRTLVLTNAAGSVDPEIGPGALLLAEDGINLFFRALTGPGSDSARLRSNGRQFFRSRGPISDPKLVELALETAAKHGIELVRGCLVGSSGPSYETAAEVRLFRFLGGSVASMSTIPEALAARELGMRTLLFSLVTNLGTGLSSSSLEHGDVIAEAGKAGGRLEGLLRALLPTLLVDCDSRSGDFNP